MAYYYPVAPVHILQKLSDDGQLKNGILILAHDVVEHEAEYAQLLKTARIDTVIVDNGTAEFGKPCSDEVLASAVHMVLDRGDMTCVMALPDVYEDAAETIRVAREFHDKGLFQNYGSRLKKMAIPQGKTQQEFMNCYEELVCHLCPELDWIGIPRNVTNNMGTREHVVRLVNTITPFLTVHLLGFSNNIGDDILSAQLREVNSIDTSVPFRAAYRGNRVRVGAEREHEPSWWNMEWNDLVNHNVSIVRKWVGRGRQ